MYSKDVTKKTVIDSEKEVLSNNFRVSFSSRLIKYSLIIPFLFSVGGGSHIRKIDVESITSAVTLYGGEVGAVGNITTRNS